jgi:hypothetical protein
LLTLATFKGASPHPTSCSPKNCFA